MWRSSLSRFTVIFSILMAVVIVAGALLFFDALHVCGCVIVNLGATETSMALYNYGIETEVAATATSKVATSTAAVEQTSTVSAQQTSTALVSKTATLAARTAAP